MSGTVEGGRAAAEANRAADPDFYRKIGSLGGKAGKKPKGFATLTKAQLRKVSRKGGMAERRPKHRLEDYNLNYEGE